LEVKILNIRIGTGPKSLSLGKNGVPGPGQYDLKTSIGEAPKYTMPSKKGGVDPNQYISSPGPAVYSPNYNKTYKNLAYSIASKPTSAKPSVTPGPGNYNLRTEKLLQVPTYK
jgi:hypothetical protein